MPTGGQLWPLLALIFIVLGSDAAPIQTNQTTTSNSTQPDTTTTTMSPTEDDPEPVKKKGLTRNQSLFLMSILAVDYGLILPFGLLFALARNVEQSEYQKDEVMFLPEGHPSMVHNWVSISSLICQLS